MAKVLLKPIVKIMPADVVCPVDLLEQVGLEVTSVDTSDTRNTITLLDFKIHDVNWSEYHFQVPENLSFVSFKLSAKIKKLALGKLVDLTATNEFRIERWFFICIHAFSNLSVQKRLACDNSLLTSIFHFASKQSSNEVDIVEDIQQFNEKQRVRIHGEVFTVLRKTFTGFIDYKVVVMGKNGTRDRWHLSRL
jgi:hypothetical protein